jgi:transcription elongation factor GreB
VSKAFTRESDEAAPEEIRSVRPALPPGAKNYITREGADRLRHRLNELLEKRRSNTDPTLDPTRRADPRTDSDIRKLESILDSVVIAETPADLDKIGLGASVVVRYSNGDEEAYQIVGVDEADPEHDRISWISPLAGALLNRKAGDTVHFLSPAGHQEMTILTVRYNGH